MTRRTLVASLAAGTMLTMACSVNWNVGGDAAAPSPAPAPVTSIDPEATAQAVDQLRAGTAFIDETSFRTDVDIAGQLTILSHTDNVNRRAGTTISLHGQITEVRMVDDDAYMRTEWELTGVGDDWMVLDHAKVPPDFGMSFEPGDNDPGGSARLINAIASAEISGNQISGTIDLTKVGQGNGISFQPGSDGTFRDGARSHPFHAALDDDGRLVSFAIPSREGSLSASLRYSDFGADVDVTRPEDAVPAPDALYPQLGMP